MTRINLIEPSQLTSRHLMAEYRELPRVFTLVGKYLEKHDDFSNTNIAGTYILGTGHVKFFYNKVLWLRQRFHSLQNELIRRNYKLNKDAFKSIDLNAIQLSILYRNLWIDYKPTPEEIYLNMARITKRSNLITVLNELEGENKLFLE